MTFTDTHCHIHEASYRDSEGAYARALDAGVNRMIMVGNDFESSRTAVEFARTHDRAWASVGIHPHEASQEIGHLDDIAQLLRGDTTRIVAIGEVGLDYFYTHSPRELQSKMLIAHLELAKQHTVPVIFHVREAFDDFWPIFDSYKGLRGVLHSYTDDLSNLDKALARGLLIGVNGIATFAKDRQDVYRSIPLSSMLLETDAPYLTPVPHRGKINEPAFITLVAQYIANLQSINLQELSRASEANATHLFAI